MSRRRINPGEADYWISALRSGQVSPPALKRRIEALTIELEDMIGLGYPEGRIEKVRETIAELEIALTAETPKWTEAAEQRMQVYGEEIAKVTKAREFHEPSSRDKLQVEIRRLQDRARMLRMDLEEALRLRDPQREIDKLREQIEFTRADLETAQVKLTRIAVANGRRRPR